MDNPRQLDCGHAFCTECIEQHFAVKKTCPTCGRVCNVIKGDQPPGTMTVEIDRYSSCWGFPNVNQIVIRYNFGGGTQGSDHPSPGACYDGITKTAYLPDSDEGRDVCRMLKLAFKRKLVFTIGRDYMDDVITWADIHHKTDKRCNA
ncbi:DTX3L-like protein, partial [Mya arenaria]